MDELKDLFPGYDPDSLRIVQAAYDIAATALKDQTRGNGKPFIEHPVNVALIAAREIGLPAGCIAAVFLHEAMRMNPDITIDKLKALIHSCSSEPEDAPEDFGKDVYTMVDGLNKIALIKPKDTRLEADNYKKLIVSYSRDPRVTVLKLADRLEVMRNLDLFPKLSRERKILETLMLYIPLAHQLGLYNMKSEMEDIYFRYAEPEQYRAITNKLKSTEDDRHRLMTDFIEPLKKKLSDAGIKYKLQDQEVMEYLIVIGLEALKNVIANKGFTESEKVQEQLKEYEETNNPILGFFEECDMEGFKIEDEQTDKVFRRYKEYCVANNFNAMSKSEFSKTLCRKLGMTTKSKTLNGKSFRIYAKG